MSVSAPRPVPVVPVFVILSAALAAFFLSTVGRSVGRSADYVQDYLSGRALFAGGSIYAPQSEELTGVTERPRERVNDHPPPYVVALAPLALLPYPAAYTALAMADILAVVAAGLLIGKSQGWGWAGGWAAVFLLLMHPGTGTGVVAGNISALLLALIVVGCWAAGRGRGLLGGVCVGVAAGVKLFPGLLGLAFVMTRDWRGAVAAGCVAVGCWAGAAAVVGVDDVRTYVTSRAPENAKTFMPSAFNLSAAGIAHRTFGAPVPNMPWVERVAERPELVTVLLWGLRGLILAVVAVGYWRTGRATSADRAFALLLPAMLLLSPLTWLHAVPLVTVSVAYLVARANTRGRQFALAVCVLALLLSDVWVGTWLADPSGGVSWRGNLAMLAPTWGLFGVMILVAAWKEEQWPQRSTKGTKEDEERS